MTEALQNFASTPLLLLSLVLLISLLESLAFIGLLVPGIALLLAAAALAGQQQIAVQWLLLAGFLGASAGDLSSYFLGRHAATRLMQTALLKRHAQWMEHSQHFFQRYGWLSVFMARFVGPIRPVLPFIAGMSGMPRAVYIGISLLAGLAWAPFYLLPGYLLGYGSHWLPELQSELTTLFSLVLFLVLIFLFSHHGLPTGNWLSRWLSAHHAPAPPDPRDHCVLYLLGFLVCVFMLGHPLANQWNETLREVLLSDISHFGVYWQWFTHLGDPLFALLTVLILGIFSGTACWRNSLLIAVLLVGVLLLSQLLKWTLAEPRPPISGLESFSFPSSHSAAAAYLWGVISLDISRGRSGSIRRLITWASLSLIVLIGLSRIALGFHWPLDVVAGVLVGATGTALYRWLQPEPTGVHYDLGYAKGIVLMIWTAGYATAQILII